LRITGVVLTTTIKKLSLNQPHVIEQKETLKCTNETASYLLESYYITLHYIRVIIYLAKPALGRFGIERHAY